MKQIIWFVTTFPPYMEQSILHAAIYYAPVNTNHGVLYLNAFCHIPSTNVTYHVIYGLSYCLLDTHCHETCQVRRTGVFKKVFEKLVGNLFLNFHQ